MSATLANDGEAVQHLGHDQGPTQCVHALAQLPDELAVSVPAGLDGRGRLELLAEAYGIRDRFRSDHRQRERALWLHGDDQVLVPPAASFAELVERVWPAGGIANVDRDDSVLAGQRVAWVTNFPAYYRLPLFRGMAQRLENVGARMRVLFLARQAPGRPWLCPRGSLGLDHDVLRSVSVPVRRRRPLVPVNLTGRLRRFRPSIVVAGGFNPSVTRPAARYAVDNGATLGLWSGETADMATAQSRLRRRQRVDLLGRVEFGIAYGCLAEQYLRGLSPDMPVVIGRNSSVTAVGGPRHYSEGGRLELLAVGDLTSRRKGVDVLIEALRLRPRLSCRLTVIGDGPGRRSLEASAAVDRRVRFVGALPPAGVRASYAEADVFLFPTRSDVFGLVLGEAMAAGLASIVSNAPGARADLAVPGRNCIVLDSHDPDVWAAAIEDIHRSPKHRLALGRAAKQTVTQRWMLDHSVEAMMAGLRLGALVRDRNGA